MILRPQHYKAIQLLTLTDMTKAEIASELEVSYFTLRRWMKDADFKAELDRWGKSGQESLDLLGLFAMKVLVKQMIINSDARIEDAPPGVILSSLCRLMTRNLPRTAPRTVGVSPLAQAPLNSLLRAEDKLRKAQQTLQKVDNT